MSRHPSIDESGVILVHVLSVVTLCAAVMTALLSVQDSAIDTAIRQSDIAHAEAAALGGETAAVIALRRDAEEAPLSDHAFEAWTSVNESGVAIEGGRFEMSVTDEQGRYNLNSLPGDGLFGEDVLQKLLSGAGVRDASVAARRIADLARRAQDSQGIADLSDLASIGLDESARMQLSDVLTALPERTPVNVNSAPEAVLSALLGNPSMARLLISRRDRKGFLTSEDFARAGVLAPAGSSFQSRYFVADIKVTQGDATYGLRSRMVRSNQDGRPAVRVWRRDRKTAAGSLQPPLEP